MATRNLVFSSVAALVVSLAAVLLISNSPVSDPPVALAGPCAAPPELYREDGDIEIVSQTLLTSAGRIRQRLYEIDSFPPGPVENKPSPLLTIEIKPTNPNPAQTGITTQLSPSQGDQQFDTLLTITTAANVPPGVYEYEIKIVCHPGEPMTTTIPVSLYVDTCPANNQSQPVGIAGDPEPFPEECEFEESPTPTPSASPGASPTPSATAPPATSSPSPGPGLQVAWGNSNCSGEDHLDEPDPVDSLFVLRGDAGLPSNTGDCPDMGADIEVLNASPHTWGDFDCLGGMSPVDSLKILRYDAGLSVTQADGCPEMAEPVTIIES